MATGFGKFVGAASLALAASMSAFNLVAPPMGGSPRPSFEDRTPEYDGLGRKKRIVPVTPPSRKKQTREWQEYARRVVATHSFNEDPRDDKYLHSSQRWGRGLRTALAARAA